MRDAMQGADKPVSSVLDNERNQIDRYEQGDEIRLSITMHPESTRTAGDVEAWYWRHVGVSAAVVEGLTAMAEAVLTMEPA